MQHPFIERQAAKSPRGDVAALQYLRPNGRRSRIKQSLYPILFDCHLHIMPAVEMCIHAGVVLTPLAVTSKASSSPNQAPDEQEDYHACCSNTHNISCKLSSAVVWIQKAIGVKSLGGICNVC